MSDTKVSERDLNQVIEGLRQIIPGCNELNILKCQINYMDPTIYKLSRDSSLAKICKCIGKMDAKGEISPEQRESIMQILNPPPTSKERESDKFWKNLEYIIGVPFGILMLMHILASMYLDDSSTL